MNRDYLLILASYIDTDNKRDIIVDTLKNLKEENIDVCLVMHSNKYCDDVVKYVKYLYYDYDNQYLTLQNYFDNIDKLNDENCTIGKDKNTKPVASWLAGPYWYTLDYVKPEYTRSAFSLIRNGSTIAYSHNYKWTVYLEWDIPIPKNGYKKLIQEKILETESQNKKCFCFSFRKYEIELKWPAIIIFDTKKLYNSDIINNKWHLSLTDWIKYWGNTNFEYCLNYLIEKEFKNDFLITDIENECEKLWGIKEYVELSRSYELQNPNISNCIINLYPKKVNEDYEMYLLIFNPSNSNKNIINYIEIYYDDKSIFNFENFGINKGSWYLQKMPEIKDIKSIKLLYKIDKESEKKEYTILCNIIDKIHKYLINLNSF